MGKPILSLDFDGVINSYVSKWQGAHVIPDPPVAGSFAALQSYTATFDVQIYSSRSHSPEGIQAMKDWFIKYGWDTDDDGELINLSFPTDKPPAFLGIDDRVLTFSGTFPGVDTLKRFKTWQNGGKHKIKKPRTRKLGKILVLVGIPASGKSTWATQQVLDKPREYKIVSKDMLRDMIDVGKYSATKEEHICYIRDSIIEYYVTQGYTVIVDDTNFNTKHWIALNALADTLGCILEEKYVGISLQEAITRNEKRDKDIPKEAIIHMWNTYIRGKPHEHDSSLTIYHTYK